MSDELKFNQENVLYQFKKQSHYPVSNHDWSKLKSTVSRCKTKEKRYFKDTSMMLFGVFLSSVLSLTTLYNTKNIASWILSTNWILLISSLFIAIACTYFDSQQIKLSNLDIDIVFQEMSNIEEKYTNPDAN
jgi:hypothetical protein